MTQATETIQRESRVKKTLLNARVNLIFYFLTLCLSFFSRKIFLDCLGADFVGLTGTLQNLLGFLNLAELGVSSAIGYVLYKPLFYKDQTKINEIISVMGYLYRWIGFVILAGGIILSLFLPLIFPDSNTGFNLALIYSAYYAFLGSSLIGYFINYRQNLLGADQRNYVVTAYFQTISIIKIIIQMALAYYTGNYYLWIAIEFAFGIIYSFILNWKINQTYPWLRTEIALGRQLLKKYPEVITKTKQLFIHKIAYSATAQTYNIIIYAVASLSSVALYGNYVIIIDKIGGVVQNALGGITASIGNLVAQNNINRTRTIYWELAALNIFVGGIVFYGIFTFSNAFINLWLGEEYILPIWIIMPYFIKKYCDYTTSNLGNFLFAHGLFYDVWAPVVEAIICIAISIMAGIYWGLFGVLLGSMVSNIIINLFWKSYFLFKKGLSLPWMSFWTFFIKYIVIQSILLYAVNELSERLITFLPTNFGYLLALMIIKTAIYTILSFGIFYICDSGFRQLVKQLINYFHK